MSMWNYITYPLTYNTSYIITIQYRYDTGLVVFRFWFTSDFKSETETRRNMETSLVKVVVPIRILKPELQSRVSQYRNHRIRPNGLDSLAWYYVSLSYLIQP